MARPGISKTEVFEKANQLVGEGIPPTIEQIRLRLGTGSNSTIASFLREWRALQNGKDEPEFNENLPHEFIGLMKGLWQRVLSQADSKVEKIRQDIEQMLTEHKTELSSLKHDHVQLQQQTHQLKNEKDLLFHDKTALEHLLADKKQEIISLNEKQNGLSTQLDEKQQLIDELRRLHKQAQENLEHYREQAREQRMLNDERHAREKQALEMNIKEFEQALMLSNQDKMKWEQNHVKIAHEKTLLQSKYDEITNHLAKLQIDCRQLEKERDDHARMLENECKQHELVLKKMNEQDRIVIELQKTNAVLSQQLHDSHQKVNDLNEQNKLLGLEKWELAQERAQLIGQMKQWQAMVHVKEVI